MADPTPDRSTGSDADKDRLESWKEIAAYLKRDVRTVQRWESREALPVHRQRHEKLGSVYAYRDEIEQWRAKRRRTPTPDGKSSFLWLYITILTVGAICLAIYLLVHKVNRPPSPIQAVAVLPLENLSSDASQDYLTEGLTDEIITDLAKLGGVRIISRTSVMRYKGTHRSIPEIARELNVDALVEGSCERLGDRVRLRVQLIRGATDQDIWAEGYDRELGDVFKLESEVARDIAVHVQLRMRQSQEQILANTHPVDPQAFQDYLKGRHYWAFAQTKVSKKQWSTLAQQFRRIRMMRGAMRGWRTAIWFCHF